MPELPQILCTQSNGRGSWREYEVVGYPDVVLIYDSHGNHEFPWFFTKVVHGVIQSGSVWRFETSYDALLDFVGWAHVPERKKK
jgi:hypothetical protein